ncbi:MAG: type ISP restriction/modification enzyme [Candidatus Woykebacteria bacterium]
MKEFLENYIKSISTKFSHEETSEMGYRSDFETLLKKIFESINVKRIDHDARAREGNKPDFIVIKGEVPILYIEAKNIGTSLDQVEKSEQMARYFGYANLVLTDYVEFRFYRNGIRYGEPVKIANYDVKGRTIIPLPKNYEYLARTLLDFTQTHKEPIKSGEHLSKIMGGKAQRIRDNVRQFLATESDKNAELTRVYETIKKLLVHDLTKESFADMYAQTLVYGLFAARYHDKEPETFSRQEARDLIPNSNPLLRHFFDHIVGPNFDKRLEHIVNELCEVFSHADVNQLMQEYFKNGSKEKTQKGVDPVIHFYEDFLKEYNPALRKRMGAYYTPLPVVQFIVRSVDYLLKKEFDLPGGLADTSKTTDGLHKVQILDPACGTGTFISAVIGTIYAELIKNGQKGRWPAYVHHDLLPRIYGFELMMAPYTIAHLKLGIAFRQTKFWDFHRRLGIYLTNSLEETPIQEDLFTAFGFAESIAEESREASIIKNETPIMVVIGNPPYAGISSNETPYANSLVERYKVEPGGQQKLQERKHWLNDDYVKFIGMAESMIEKTGIGIVAMITNNGYLDNPTFRGMRWHIAKTFDKVFLLDLHGNSKKKETAPDGTKDENVFDIMQGVGIMLAVKMSRKSPDKLGEIYHAELYGTRQHKFKELSKSPNWEKITLDSKMAYFVPKNTKGQGEYEKGIRLEELFSVNSVGIVTGKDKINIGFSKNEIIERFRFISENGEQSIRDRFHLSSKDARDWTVSTAKRDAENNFSENKVVKCSYRPFDDRYTFYSGNSRGVYASPQRTVMRHYLLGENYGLLFSRMTKGKPFAHAFITSHISEVIFLSPLTGTNAFNAPLYIYSEDGLRTTNLKKEVVLEIEKIVGKSSPEDIFDYVYAVLYLPNYREKYQEFLKIDFPRVPYPKDKKQFQSLIKLGRELRALHLLESPKLNKFITTYPESGDDVVEKVEYKDGNVFINAKQYFGKVPEVAWNFWIGGYQPAQKWLKDRKGRTLTNEDIEHYQKIIVALTETGKIMGEIDKVVQ